MSEPTAPKANKASRKNKKSWRKNVDMTQVNQFLEERRFEERVGGSFSERPDEKLFSIETEAEIVKPTKNRKEIKPLRCFANLEGLPGAKDPMPIRNYTKTPEERENPIVKQMKLQKVKSGKIQKKHVDGKKDRAAHLKKKEAGKEEAVTRRRTKFDFDMWGEEGGDSIGKDSSEPNPEWIKKEGLIHNAMGRNKFTPKFAQSRNFSTGTLVSTVEVPDPGASYNPNLEDHQELLWKAAIVEIQKEKEIQRIERQTTGMFPGKAQAPTAQSIMKEMSEGIVELGGVPDEEDEAPDGDEPNDEEYDNSVQGVKPKTRKQKRDKRKRMFEEQKVAREKDVKLKETEINRVKSIRKELKADDEKTLKNQAKKAEDTKEKMASGPLKLSNYKFEPQEIEIKLSDELTGNLRNLTPEGSILEDRFKSLQKRNLIEVRVKQKTVKRLKRKTFEKRSHRMGWEENKNVIAKKIRAEKKARAKKKQSAL